MGKGATESSVESISGGSDSKESACDVGDLGSIPWSGRFPRGRNDNPLQYSCLETPVDRGAWQASVQGVAKEPDTLERLSHTHTPGLMVLFPVLFLHHLLSLSARHPFVFLDQGSADILGPKRDCFQLCSNDPLPQDSPKSAWTAWTGKCGVSQ